MYVGRKVEQLQNIAFGEWTLEELAYHRDQLQELEQYLSQEGRELLQDISQEINSRGGLPQYGGAYDLPSSVRYD